MKKLLMLCFMVTFTAAISAQDATGTGHTKTDTRESSASQSHNSDSKSSRAKVDDKTMDFVKEAASGGMMEVQLGKLAQKKASSKDVKDFGALMVKDHSKANDQLKSVAKKNNITLSKKLMDKHQKHVDELSKLSGKDFDEEYVNMMKDDHEEDISKFQKASEDLENNDVKNFAKNTLPVLKKHKEKVDQIDKDMKSISRSDNSSKNK
jgi:putative membrane protein